MDSLEKSKWILTSSLNGNPRTENSLQPNYPISFHAGDRGVQFFSKSFALRNTPLPVYTNARTPQATTVLIARSGASVFVSIDRLTSKSKSILTSSLNGNPRTENSLKPNYPISFHGGDRGVQFFSKSFAQRNTPLLFIRTLGSVYTLLIKAPTCIRTNENRTRTCARGEKLCFACGLIRQNALLNDNGLNLGRKHDSKIAPPMRGQPMYQYPRIQAPCPALPFGRVKKIKRNGDAGRYLILTLQSVSKNWIGSDCSSSVMLKYKTRIPNLEPFFISLSPSLLPGVYIL
ncbi:hypothetical protein CEXT_748441 [Caerostris extrusa]|uniref:Uncharacterized protein n=1 Tax=Caerostris extrusa TaxID=172846 RepID=A0AAV4NAQ2_CAEEX|nr:hypothetical protein CEXT_748441 [Caerostris extrusa]